MPTGRFFFSRRLKLARLAALGAAMAAMATGSAGAQAGAPCTADPAWGVVHPAESEELIAGVNTMRAQRGVAPLQVGAALQRTATVLTLSRLAGRAPKMSLAELAQACGYQGQVWDVGIEGPWDASTYLTGIRMFSVSKKAVTDPRWQTAAFAYVTRTGTFRYVGWWPNTKLVFLLGTHPDESPSPPAAASPDSVRVLQGMEVRIPVLANDGSDSYLGNVLSRPRGGKAAVVAGGIVSYRSRLDFFGRDRFRYQAVSASGRVREVEVAVEVVRDPHVLRARPDTFRLTCLRPDSTPWKNVKLDVLANDDGRGLHLVAASDDNDGSVRITPNRRSIIYEHRSTWKDHFSFPYTVRDGKGRTATSRVTIVVECSRR
jgi:hypothetical protein